MESAEGFRNVVGRNSIKGISYVNNCSSASTLALALLLANNADRANNWNTTWSCHSRP